MGQREFALYWGWPRVNTGADEISEEVDRSVTQAVIEYEEGEQTKTIFTKSSPFVFKGSFMHRTLSAYPFTHYHCIPRQSWGCLGFITVTPPPQIFCA